MPVLFESSQSLETDSSHSSASALPQASEYLWSLHQQRRPLPSQPSPWPRQSHEALCRCNIHLPYMLCSSNSTLLQCCYWDVPVGSDEQQCSLHWLFHNYFSSAGQQLPVLPPYCSVSSHRCCEPPACASQNRPRRHCAAHFSSHLSFPSYTLRTQSF